MFSIFWTYIFRILPSDTVRENDSHVISRVNMCNQTETLLKNAGALPVFSLDSFTDPWIVETEKERLCSGTSPVAVGDEWTPTDDRMENRLVERCFQMQVVQLVDEEEESDPPLNSVADHPTPAMKFRPISHTGVSQKQKPYHRNR
jgi:hypothetical protein